MPKIDPIRDEGRSYFLNLDLGAPSLHALWNYQL